MDSIAGGGGIISLPAYLFAGFPAHMAMGCNKLSSSCGLAAASYKYIKEGKVRYSIALWSALGCIIGAFCGARLALLIAERTLRIMMLAAVPVIALFLALRKDIGSNEGQSIELSRKKEALLALAIGAAVGVYDGLIGPGAGTFLILGFTAFLGTELVQASACAKLSNLASNVTSVIIYALSGNVLFRVALPAAVCSMAGAYFGARTAVRGGGKRIKQVMYIVLILLFVKIVYDLLLGQG